MEAPVGDHAALIHHGSDLVAATRGDDAQPAHERPHEKMHKDRKRWPGPVV